MTCHQITDLRDVVNRRIAVDTTGTAHLHQQGAVVHDEIVALGIGDAVVGRCHARGGQSLGVHTQRLGVCAGGPVRAVGAACNRQAAAQDPRCGRRFTACKTTVAGTGIARGIGLTQEFAILVGGDCERTRRHGGLRSLAIGDGITQTTGGVGVHLHGVGAHIEVAGGIARHHRAPLFEGDGGRIGNSQRTGVTVHQVGRTQVEYKSLAIGLALGCATQGDGWAFAVNGVQACAQGRQVAGGHFIAGIAESPAAAANQGRQPCAARDAAGVQGGASPCANRNRFACGQCDVAATAVVKGCAFGHRFAFAGVQRDRIDGGAGGVDVFTEGDVAGDGLDQDAARGVDAGRVDRADGDAIGVHIAQAAHAGVRSACGQHGHIVVGIGQCEATRAQQAQAIGHQFAIGTLGHLARGGDHDAVVGDRGVACCGQGFVDGNSMPHQGDRPFDRGGRKDTDVAGVARLAQRQTTQIGHVVDGDVGHALQAHQVVARQGTIPVEVAGKPAAAWFDGQRACGVQGQRTCVNELQRIRAQGDARACTRRDGGGRRGRACVAVAAANGAAVQRLQGNGRVAAGAGGGDARARENHHGPCRTRTRFSRHGQGATGAQHGVVAHKQAKQIARIDGGQVATVQRHGAPGDQAVAACDLNAEVAVGLCPTLHHHVAARIDARCRARQQNAIVDVRSHRGFGAASRQQGHIAFACRCGRGIQAAGPQDARAVKVETAVQVRVQQQVTGRGGQAGVVLVTDLSTVNADVARHAHAAVDRDQTGVGVLTDHQATQVGHVLEDQVARTGHTGCAGTHPMGAAHGALQVEGVAKAVVKRPRGEHPRGVHRGGGAGGVNTTKVDAVAHKGHVAAAGIYGNGAAGGVDVPAGVAHDIGLARGIKVTAAGIERALQVHAVPVGAVRAHRGTGTHRQAVPGGAGIGRCATVAAHPDVTAFGGHGGVVEEAHATVAGAIGVRPEDHVELAGVGTTGRDVGDGGQPIVGLERECGIAAAGFADGRIDVDAIRPVAEALHEDVATARDGQGLADVDRAAVSRDGAGHVHVDADHVGVAVQVDRCPCVAGFADRQAGHGLAVLVPVEPLGEHVLTKRIGERHPQHIATGGDLGVDAPKVVRIKTNGQVGVGRKTGVSWGTAPPLEMRLAQEQSGTLSPLSGGAQQVQRPAVGDEVRAVADQHRPLVAVTIERDAATRTTGDELLIAVPAAAICGTAQVDAMVPPTAGGGVAAFDGDGVCTGKGRTDVHRIVGHDARFDRARACVSGNALDVNFAHTRVGGEWTFPNAHAPGAHAIG